MAETIFSEMSRLAAENDAINLGQGFPDTPGPLEVVDAAVAAMHKGWNQYPPAVGIPSLRRAIADHQRRWYGLDVAADGGVVVCSGASEALSSAMTALLRPGDEVIALEPFYDLYGATAQLLGATLVPVRIHAPDYAVDADALRAAVTGRTRMIVLNTPHNPTGAVLSRAELQSIADVAIENDLVVLADEVYEHLVFDDNVHVPIATLPGMFERTITVGSGGKTFSVTGWKIGWATGPADLVEKVLGVKQWFSFAAGTPLQHGIATGLDLPDDRLAHLGDDLARKRDLLTDGLRELGLEVFHSKATYFVTADVAPLGVTDSLEFCRTLPERVRVAAVPNQVFHASPEGVETQVRFACCKRDEILADALLRLRKL
ncbi:aminotransferase [Actinomycetospora sp. NBRC 106375]|uniref:aminotransferase class I/II-fold pyridoxal phosphate-dependent enzyme n=1 Tax=Actinomycetospora sp. NBRC 106375 TaxID=3032207 RepID=UPI0024A076C0|nr:aminotransferase class I/II-fold pyridoxal phosphate-dependent enzyme [Actinomycetospora sp. NBRC 106375]GLZ44566.1 aminotransferase [Actinomycetospora sp. NBRC 106375]